MSKSFEPYSMIIGVKYYLTEPCYDDYNEGLKPETNLVEVISKDKTGIMLKNIKYDYTYKRTYQHLLTCKITQY